MNDLKMKLLSVFLMSGLIFAGFSSCRKYQKVVTVRSLLNEMTDLERLTTLDGLRYKTLQFSSHDRRSKNRSDSLWFANEDGFGGEPLPGFEKVLKEADPGGVGEYLICDLNGPGVIQRLWTASITGKIRFFLDNNEKPVFEGEAKDFFWNPLDKIAGFTDSEKFQGTFRQFDANYFPIPFAKRCRMEWIGDIGKIHFYHVGLRIYDKGSKVQTFRIADFRSIGKKVTEAGNKLNNPGPEDPLSAPKVQIPEREIPDSGNSQIFYNRGSRSIEYLSLRISAADMENALRKSLLTICFDDASIPQAEAPVGDFFGSAPGLNPYSSLPFTIQSDGTMICRFVMPFKKSVRIDIRNFSGETIKVSGAIGVADNKWEEGKSMYFMARWRIDHGLTASGFDAGKNGVQDIVYLMASGTGRIVGAGAFLYNPSKATTSWGNWWGEGDEKIFVDRDTFPIIFRDRF